MREAGTVLFLSYAEDDGKTGIEIAEWLAGQGFEVYYWQDPKRRGGRFIEQIEKAIGQADAFVALLSPSFVRSQWCRHERELALQREIDLRARAPSTIFIHVLKVSDTPADETGFLRSYDWGDLTSSQSWEPALTGLADRLRHGEGVPGAESSAPGRAATGPSYYGHREELDKVVRSLASPAGRHFWLVAAPPGLGKSCFLRRVSAALASPEFPAWVPHLVDLREQPSDVRTDPAALLARLAGRAVHATDPEALRDLAADIAGSGKSWLCLLDSAELLDGHTSAALRSCLSHLYRHMREVGPANVGLALVVASRQDKQWRAAVPDPRLSLLRLGELKTDDVRRALHDLASQPPAPVSPATLQESTDLVLQLTEGLPALLAPCLEWIRRERWLQVERLASGALFEELAEPYIQQRLLTPDGLGPGSRGWAGQRRYALEQAFRVLAPYRLFTQSHLRHHVQSDPALRGSVENAAWSIEDLWRAISESALLAPLDEPWREIHPAIRRLLFRYYYGSIQSRIQAHRDARAFVQHWTDHLFGKEQVVGMVECLWHEAAALSLAGSATVPGQLGTSAELLFRALQPSAAYSAAELRAYAADRIRNDAEFQQMVHDITGIAGIVVAPTLSGYVLRPEELQISAQAALVQKDLRSRAVLLYGQGGAGKTWLVRQLALARTVDQKTIWLDPIDLDDSESWLLSNVERRVAHRLDPDNRHFGPYQEYISRIPAYSRSPVSYETVVGYLGRIKRTFVECYTRFVAETGTTVVITFDTVEAIRGTYLLLSLTQWMKTLPSTLFIVSGRPDSRSPDPIRMELEDSYSRLPVTTVWIGDFGWQAALDYLSASPAAAGLTDSEKAKLVHLTRGHPLWMAFTISYLKGRGIPAEAETVSLADIERDMPYGAAMTAAGQILAESFRRRLILPYQAADFWAESVRRLAVVRQGISLTVWQSLMSDIPLPDGVATAEQAWEALLRTPWIRPRANDRFLTLHDAVAEELAQRIIPLHDQNQTWRRAVWRRAVGTFTELIEKGEAGLARQLLALDERLEDLGRQRQSVDYPPDATQAESIDEVSRLDARKRELYQLKTARMSYQLFCDYDEGCRQFLDLFSLARDQDDVIFQDLLALEMQRFLPGGDQAGAVGDVLDAAIADFRAWLTSDGGDLYLAIGLAMAGYLMANEQPASVIELLDGLSVDAADHRQRSRMDILRGNACMRIPGQEREGHRYFLRALGEAEALTSDDRATLVARSHKELGFYYRNAGEWRKADLSYQQAHDTVSEILVTKPTDDLRAEMASVQANWAYLKGVLGQYREGQYLVESAITVCRHLHQRIKEGSSWSVCGEVYRYERRFHKAWDAYAEAEKIFLEHRNWPWLGLIYQEQAICLFQAAEDGVTPLPGGDPVEHAKRLIMLALDLCRDLSVRAYPAALNRAGRIFGQHDHNAGLRYLADGIECAHSLSDGWFWIANLIEYVELSYRAWLATSQSDYLHKITARAPDIQVAMSEYEFPVLRGRWRILQGHLAVDRSLETGDAGSLDGALENYREGFALLAREYVGSSGAYAIPKEFGHFRLMLTKLPPGVRARWLSELRHAWSGEMTGSTLLLAHLAELY
jgi:hypothetical protein